VLFNSVGFIFAFLPIVVIVFQLLQWSGRRLLARWLLILATLAFYGFANGQLLPLLLVSVLANYLAGVAIARSVVVPRLQQWVVAGAVCANLLCLGYYKYYSYLSENWSALAASNHLVKNVAIPLGISFFTFQQIGYLIDVNRGKISAGSPLAYANFVLFFPQLLAGPIVQYTEISGQLCEKPRKFNVKRDAATDIIIGLTIFAIGLFKKTVVADTAALYATPVFVLVRDGTVPIGIVAGWLGTFAYTAQVYFDFSGYSDMAIGTARMLGVILPLNFHSPLRSGSVVELWRRWHITLGRWVQGYIFQPLAMPMARMAAERDAGKWGSLVLAVIFPTMVTMFIVGVWHGAGWNFAIFGLMQGLYMSINEGWALYRKKARKGRKGAYPLWHRPLAVVATLIAFDLSIVPFGTADLAGMTRLFAAMAGVRGLLFVPADWPLGLSGALAALGAVYGSIFLMPNTQQIMASFEPVLEMRKWIDPEAPALLRWRATWGWAIVTGSILFLGVSFIMRGATKFVYFNF